METREPSDDDLVRRTLAGDREAFAVLHQRYARLAQAVAADLGPDRSRTDDAVQETFLRAYRGLGRLRDPSRFGPWLAGIARQVVREQRRRRRMEPLPDAVPDPRPPTAEADDEQACLLAHVAALPEEARLAVRLFFLTGRGAEETARLLGRSRSATYRLLREAVARLARSMGAAQEAPP